MEQSKSLQGRSGLTLWPYQRAELLMKVQSCSLSVPSPGMSSVYHNWTPTSCTRLNLSKIGPQWSHFSYLGSWCGAHRAEEVLTKHFLSQIYSPPCTKHLNKWILWLPFSWGICNFPQVSQRGINISRGLYGLYGTVLITYEFSFSYYFSSFLPANASCKVNRTHLSGLYFYWNQSCIKKTFVKEERANIFRPADGCIFSSSWNCMRWNWKGPKSPLAWGWHLGGLWQSDGSGCWVWKKRRIQGLSPGSLGTCVVTHQ